MQPTATPVVSVIIPTYNCGLYIGEAISSVLAQTYDSYEIIVVDDGSTDDTKSALAPFMGKIQYLYHNNRGVAAARNTGIARARGEYVTTLDADDVWFPAKLELQVQALKEHPEAGLVFTDFQDFDDTGVTRSSRLNTRSHAQAWFDRQRVGDSEIACGPMYQELIETNWIHASSAIVRRDVLDEVGWFDESLRAGEDLELWLRIARRYPFLCMNRVLSGYRYRPESLCGPTDSRAKRINLIVAQVLEKHLQKRLIPHGLKGSAKITLCQRYWALGWNSFGENRFAEARQFFSQGSRHQPFNRQFWMYWLASFLPLPLIEAIRRMRLWRRGFHWRTQPAPQEVRKF